MTKAIAIIALTCVAALGAAATSILGRDGVPSASADLASAMLGNPVPNREIKGDRLGAPVLALATIEARQPTPEANEMLRQAFAAATPGDIEAPKTEAPAAVQESAEPAPPVPPPAKPKPVAKPQVQKSYALLSDVQIAGIKERLRLSSAQENYWPAVESALRAIARKIHSARQSNPNATAASIDPDSEEVQQLKSAAMPLLFQLRDDQKEEVRKLARIIGLDQVAAAI